MGNKLRQWPRISWMKLARGGGGGNCIRGNLCHDRVIFRQLFSLFYSIGNFFILRRQVMKIKSPGKSLEILQIYCEKTYFFSQCFLLTKRKKISSTIDLGRKPRLFFFSVIVKFCMLVSSDEVWFSDCTAWHFGVAGLKNDFWFVLATSLIPKFLLLPDFDIKS